MITFLVTVLAILGLIHWFLYARLAIALNLTSPSVLWPLRLLFVFLAVSYLLARTVESKGPEPLVHALHWVSSVWLGLMWELLWLALLFYLAKLILLATGVWGKLDPQTILTLGRYSTVTVIGVAVLLCGYATARALGPARVVRVQVPVKHITPELRQMKIALASDFHAGVLVDHGQLVRMSNQIMSLKPDLILLPGDIVDRNVDQIIKLTTALHSLQAPLGVFGTTGNHEYYIGLPGALKFCEMAGIHMLMNEYVELPGGLVVAGIEDRTARQMNRPRPSVEELMATVPKDRAVILMNHTPEATETIAAGHAGADLVLSGHTHGGQLWPFTIFTKMTFRFHHGLYRLDPGYNITSNGIGHWGPPMRLNAPPEIVLIRLVGPDEQAKVVEE